MTELQPLLLPIARDPIAFVVPGEPKRKTRPRFRIFFQKGIVDAIMDRVRAHDVSSILGVLRKMTTVSTYTDPETKADEEEFQWRARKHRPKKLLEGPLRVDLTFVLSIPRSWPPRDKAAALAGAKLPTGKPDRDNFEKFALDAMNGLFYRDDSQVVAGESRKVYGLDPRTEVRITPIIEGDHFNG